ncbi:uncharacterized protein LOC122263472 [Penaeus japonicus]|uniref:uncharacterized protein LOC122263472 n=1 Tax=Penaeus japonicus TaxID=27405 RepID=UPI001C71222B|nr:uncharacterized protein LOC122263472 [Penaeus japonicus]
MRRLWASQVALLLAVLVAPALPQGPLSRDGGGHGGGGHGGGGHGGGGHGGGGHGGGGGYGGHGGGGGGHGGGGYGGGGGGGGYHVPAPTCHPQTITKYRTVYKDRKAQVVNNVEVRNPKPDVKKVVETRYTTIRYPVFITQVIKPLLTQVETKVRPMFFTKTIDRYTTVKFTVTGIGQVTVTTVKYEKEYVTRCMKKGYGHRREAADDGPEVRESDVIPVADAPALPTYRTRVPEPPPGIPYDYDYDYGDGAEIQPSLPTPERETSPPERPFLRPITHGGFRGPRPRPPPALPPVGPPAGPRGILGALSQLGEALTGSHRDPGGELYQPHPPLPLPPVAFRG